VNLSFLGDALDHWKGSLFESLQQAGVLRNFAVDAMASDWPAWQPEDVSLFSRLLKIDESQLIKHSVGLATREPYFDDIQHTGDVFLDPDIGVATGRVKNVNQYVRPSEIGLLLHDRDRLLAVYQHVRAQAVSQRVDTVCRALNGAIDGCNWSSYESGTVAMMFLSRSYQRVAEVTTHFRQLLGRHAIGRVRASSNNA